MGIKHQKVQLFDAFLVVDGGDQHTARVDAHHRPGWEVHDGDAGLADEFFRLVVFVDTGKNDSIGAGSVVQHEFQQLLGLFDRFAGFDLDGAEVGFRERLEVHEVLEQRFDLDLGEVDGIDLGGCGRSGFCLRSVLLRHVQRLHRRDYKTVKIAEGQATIYCVFLRF